MMKALQVGGVRARLAHVALGLAAACGSSDTTSVSVFELEEGSAEAPATEGTAASHPIAFQSNRYTAELTDIHRLALDGDVLQVTRGAGADQPRWSPSGDAIAFREQIDNTYAEVGLVAPDGTERVLLTSGEPSVFLEYPVNWTPDEAGIVFAARPDAELTRIWVAPRNGGPRQPLFADDSIDRRELAWSPDGRRIAYADYDRGAARHGDGISRDIWVADALEPSRAVNVTSGRVHAPVQVRWAPDARRVAFQAYALAADGSIEALAPHEQSGPYVPPDYETFIVDVDTGALTRVTDDVADEKGLAWSPDGSGLLVASERDGDLDLWLIPLDDPSQARNLIDDNDLPSDDQAPDWFQGRP